MTPPLPNNTPVTAMGLAPSEVTRLTPAAQNVTRGQLINLRNYAATRRDYKEDVVVREFNKEYGTNLTMEDIYSIYDAFSALDDRRSMDVEGEGGFSCCCCTPCCSCGGGSHDPSQQPQ